ncbi:hypothetical protein DL96DRAFT_1558777 [Flagelloscypha sp. PMI_526]|nr:hypothetical protein DL96DRAFT_1558777 [Flagelloscypha sp. PMI_526]
MPHYHVYRGTAKIWEIGGRRIGASGVLPRAGESLAGVGEFLAGIGARWHELGSRRQQGMHLRRKVLTVTQVADTHEDPSLALDRASFLIRTWKHSRNIPVAQLLLLSSKILLISSVICISTIVEFVIRVPSRYSREQRVCTITNGEWWWLRIHHLDGTWIEGGGNTSSLALLVIYTTSSCGLSNYQVKIFDSKRLICCVLKEPSANFGDKAEAEKPGVMKERRGSS